MSMVTLILEPITKDTQEWSFNLIESKLEILERYADYYENLLFPRPATKVEEVSIEADVVSTIVCCKQYVLRSTY